MQLAMLSLTFILLYICEMPEPLLLAQLKKG